MMNRRSFYLITLIVITLLLTLTACAGKTLEERAHAALDADDYDRAIDLFGRAIRQEGERASFYYWRGTAYYARYTEAFDNDDPRADPTDYELAIDDFTTAIRLDQTYAEAYNYRGLTYAAYNRYQEALADYNTAIALAPTLATPYYARGLILQELGQTDDAIADFQQFLELNTDPYWEAEARKRLEELEE